MSFLAGHGSLSPAVDRLDVPFLEVCQSRLMALLGRCRRPLHRPGTVGLRPTPRASVARLATRLSHTRLEARAGASVRLPALRRQRLGSSTPTHLRAKPSRLRRRIHRPPLAVRPVRGSVPDRGSRVRSVGERWSPTPGRDGPAASSSEIGDKMAAPRGELHAFDSREGEAFNIHALLKSTRS